MNEYNELPFGTIIVCPHCGTKNTRTETRCLNCDTDLTEARARLAIPVASQGISINFEEEVLEHLQEIRGMVTFLFVMAIIGLLLGLVGVAFFLAA